MRTRLFFIVMVTIFTIGLSSCEKAEQLSIEKDLRNTVWIDVDNPNCDLIIGTDAVILCGYNLAGIAGIPDSENRKVRARYGQIKWKFWYDTNFTYILDYEFDGEYLWVVKDNTDVHVPCIGYGRKFVRK